MRASPAIRPGDVLVVTVTTNEPVAVLPCASVAVHDTVVAPIPNVAPDAGTHAGTTAPSTRSAALALNGTTAPAGVVAVAARSRGSVNAGGVVSLTVTLKVAVPLQPLAAVAWTVNGN